jgi:type VI protein secretion system component VasF
MDDRSREMSDSLRRAADGFTRAGRGLMVAHECMGLAYQGLVRAATAAEEPESSMHGVRDELGQMAHMAENLAAAVQHLAEEVRDSPTRVAREDFQGSRVSRRT